MCYNTIYNKLLIDKISIKPIDNNKKMKQEKQTKVSNENSNEIKTESQKINSEIKYSIIIPSHNAANYMVRCFTSIAKQTLPLDNVEIVFVNDASTDGSGYIAERFSEDFPHFNLVNVTDGPNGPGGARNIGVCNAIGKYIFFVDQDDYLPEKSLEIIDKALTDANEPDVCLYPYSIIKPNNNQLIIPPFKNIQEAAFSAVAPWSIVFKHELFVPFPEKTLSEDTAWHFAQFDKFDTMVNAGGKEPCYVYDRSNTTAITDTVEWLANNSFTLEQLAFENIAIRNGKRDQWISDVIRNLANMYDVRRTLTKKWVKDAWAARFKKSLSNILTGHFVH